MAGALGTEKSPGVPTTPGPHQSESARHRWTLSHYKAGAFSPVILGVDKVLLKNIVKFYFDLLKAGEKV